MKKILVTRLRPALPSYTLIFGLMHYVVTYKLGGIPLSVFVCLRYTPLTLRDGALGFSELLFKVTRLNVVKY